MTCHELEKLLHIEVKALRKEIEVEKWYLSEMAHHDVGWKFAEHHYIHTHLNGWAAGFKDCYCNKVCQEKNCEYRRELDA